MLREECSVTTQYCMTMHSCRRPHSACTADWLACHSFRWLLPGTYLCAAASSITSTLYQTPYQTAHLQQLPDHAALNCSAEQDSEDREMLSGSALARRCLATPPIQVPATPHTTNSSSSRSILTPRHRAMHTDLIPTRSHCCLPAQRTDRWTLSILCSRRCG